MIKNEKGAVIITHLQSEDSCALGQTVMGRGIRVRTINAPRSGLDDIDPLRPDLMVFMGGPIGVYQADEYPFLKQEIEIIKKRLDADLPTIGICLGSQLIAAAAGEKVYRGKQQKEVGWTRLEITEQGKGKPIEHICGSKTNMFHWHGDTFDMPKGATHLARTKQFENQAFSIGNSMALQCHPEVQLSQLQEWFVMFQRDITGDNPLIPVNELRKQTFENIETLNTQARLFFNEWLEQVGL